MYHFFFFFLQSLLKISLKISIENKMGKSGKIGEQPKLLFFIIFRVLSF